MKPKHLSYKRAIATCLDHQHLIGKPFSPGQASGGKIQRVLIAPYNRILRWQFLAEVFAGADPDRALAICRDGKYEVVVLSEHYSPELEQHRPKTLSEYVQECGLAGPILGPINPSDTHAARLRPMLIGNIQAGNNPLAS